MMKITQGLVSISMVIAASVAPSSTNAASSCIQVEANSSATLCAGQPATASASISNSCPSAARVTVGFAIDGRSLPAKSSVLVNGDATLSKQVTILIPARAVPGSHTLTVTATDAEGNASSADVDVTVASCPTP